MIKQILVLTSRFSHKIKKSFQNHSTSSFGGCQKASFSACLAIALFLINGCSSSPGSQNTLKVAATPVPHAQILEFVKPDLKEKGIELVIITTDDYNLPNRALAEKDVDANFFQHIPFMDLQIKEFKYPIQSDGKIEIEPMGVYSKKVTSIQDLKEKATIAIPDDPSNEARALLLLEEHGMIKLDDPHNLNVTILNIIDNPKQFKFIEVDAAMLPRALQDVDAAVINTNYALEAHLNPTKDALILENKDSPYANIVAIRIGDENRPEIQALIMAMTSEKTRQFIIDKFNGAVLPAF